MTFLKTTFRSFVTGLSSVVMVGGWSAALGTVAIATATPAAACGVDPYIGTICTVAFSYCPQGYIEADGRLLPINAHQALHSLIGFAYGGDNTTNFAIPDLKGRTVIGKGQGTGLSHIQIAKKVGQQELVLTTSQVPLKYHSHEATFHGTGGGSTHINVPASPGTLNVTSKLKALQASGIAQPQAGKFLGMGGSGNQQAPIYATSTATATAVDLGGLEVQLTGTAGHGAVDFDIMTGITGGTVSLALAGSDPIEAVSTQSPGLGVTFCIADTGIYPVRP